MGCVDDRGAGSKSGGRVGVLTDTSVLDIEETIKPATYICGATAVRPSLRGCAEAMSLYVVNQLPVGTHVDPGLWRESLSFRACVHRESPIGSVLVEPQDIERAVGAFDLAIAVIGAEPLIEDFNDLDHASIHSEAPRHGQTVGFAAVD